MITAKVLENGTGQAAAPPKECHILPFYQNIEKEGVVLYGE